MSELTLGKYGEVLLGGSEMWDNTKLKAYGCEMRGKLGYEEHLIPIEPREALVFGGAMHKAVEVWTRERMEGKQDVDAVSTAERAFVEIWEKDLPQERREMLELGGDRRSVQNFRRLFGGYRKKFPLEGFDRVVSVETPVTALLGEVDGEPVYWTAVLDRVVEQWGGVYYREVKTSSFPLDDSWFYGFRRSGQLHGQVWLGQNTLGTKFTGAVVEGIQVQAPLKTKVRAADELVQCEVIPFTQENLEEWRENVLLKVRRIRQARAEGRYVMDNGDLCGAFRDGCEYRKVCNAMPDARGALKEQHFTRRVWNPLAK